MTNPQPKQRIKVIRPGRGYERGKTYTIVRVDPSDNTLVAADSSGKEGSWVKWDHCVAGGGEVNWSWLKGQLSADALELLSAFEGLEALRLKDEIRDHILLQLPGLKDRILRSQIQLEEEFGARFLRVHRNALVAPAWVRGLHRDAGGEWVLEMDGVDARPVVSRRHLADVRAALADL
jgi:hypothetical protein